MLLFLRYFVYSAESDGLAKYFFSSRFGGDDWSTVAIGNVKFVAEMNRERSYGYV